MQAVSRYPWKQAPGPGTELTRSEQTRIEYQLDPIINGLDVIGCRAHLIEQLKGLLRRLVTVAALPKKKSDEKIISSVVFISEVRQNGSRCFYYGLLMDQPEAGFYNEVLKSFSVPIKCGWKFEYDEITPWTEKQFPIEWLLPRKRPGTAIPMVVICVGEKEALAYLHYAASDEKHAYEELYRLHASLR
ncbi:hypothetical protein KW797_01235 [Candidatus Parcubacteria bacterium]|nr:hypothetical protein [Candidatus Parcubacteria bacterium]